MLAKPQLCLIFLSLFIFSASFSMENPRDDENFCRKYGKSLAEINLAYESAPLDAKDIVDKLTCPHRYPLGFYRASLFLGDPGVGKTTLAIAIGLIAKEVAGWFFEFFTHADFDGSDRNATGIKLKNKLQDIIDSGEKTLIVIDELHLLLDNSGDKNYDTANTSSTLWTFLDHQTFNENFFFIGIMNYGDKMAEPMKDRMCLDYVEFPKPSPIMKRTIFRSKLTNALTRIHNDCNNDEFIDTFLLQLEGWSSRNIERLVSKAFDIARRNDKDSSIITINREHLETAYQFGLRGRNVKFQCGKKEESEAERLHKASLAHSEKLYDLGVAQQAFMQLKLKSVDRSAQVNGGLNGGISFGTLGVNGNVGLNVGGGGAHSIVLASDYEVIKSGLTNKQVELLDAILEEANTRIIAQDQHGNLVPINRSATGILKDVVYPAAIHGIARLW